MSPRVGPLLNSTDVAFERADVSFQSLHQVGAALLCAATLPNMFASSVFTLMGGLGMISLAANGAKSYQMRGGDLHEPRFE
jgi:hypothetical protein